MRGSDLSRRRRRPEQASSVLLWVAAVIGLLNAAPNVYWAFGGDFLLETVGMWLVDLRGDSPTLTGLALVLISAVKIAVSVLPLLLQGSFRYGQLVWWTAVAASAGLLVYGASGALVNTALLLFTTVEDPTARMGQALIWYPMLLIWGLVLACGLSQVRQTASRGSLAGD